MGHPLEEWSALRTNIATGARLMEMPDQLFPSELRSGQSGDDCRKATGGARQTDAGYAALSMENI